MQLFSRKTAILAVSFGAMTALGACGDDVTVTPAPVSPVVISITPSNVTLNIGESTNLAVQITGGSGPTLASCTSSNTAVATAAVSGSSCRVTAVASGNVSVTAAASTGGVAAAAVTVAPAAAAISGLQLSPTAASVAVNQSVTIVPTVTKGNGVAVTYAFASSSATIASVNATTGVVTAVAPGVATITVTATGTGTGFTSTTLTSASTVTVTALPSGLTALNVTPSSLALAIGGTAQIGATSTQPSGAAAATYTYTTGSATVATVSATGLVAAVAPGTTIITVTASSAANSNFAAASLSSAVAVTVSPRAQIALTYVNTPAGQAVDIANVQGQIQVGLNMITNGQIVTSAQVFACPTSATTCPAAGQTPAAQQTFGAGGGSTGTFELSINTADFTVASDWSAATASYVNGQTTLVATITVAAATGSTANSNLAILNLNNADGFAARHVAPATSVVLSNGSAFFGGPTARGSVSIAPVIYSAGRTINSAAVTVAGCAASYTFVTGTDARPWTMTYGAGTSSGTFKSCAYETLLAGAPDVFPTVTASIDNNNLAGPTAAAVVNFLQTTTSSPAVTRPGAIRVDFVGPTGVTYTMNAATNGTAGWANASYNFATNTGNITGADAGTGLNTAAYKYEYTGCPVATTPVYTTMTTNTGADIAECATDFTANPYKVRFTAADKLGNLSTAAVSGLFGVDKTAPAVRYAASTDTNMTIYSVAPTPATTADTIFSAEALDERSGLSTAMYSFATATKALSTGSCVTGYPTTTPATTTPGATFITAPNCTYIATGVSYGAALGDGYRPIATPQQTVSYVIADGYVTYSVRSYDRAANVTTTDFRYVLLNTTTPTVTVTQPLVSPISSTFTGTFAGTFSERVEAQYSAFRAIYTGGDTLQFPAAATGVLAFDNLISTATAITGGFPFTTGTTFYTNIETVDAVNNSFTGTTNAAADSVGLFVRNFGGFGAESYKSTVINTVASVTPDATAWATKAPLVSSFAVSTTTAGFNAPAGGLKVQISAATTVINSPLSRVDFYRQVSAGRSEYMGSIDASAAPCTSASLTCNVYVADNGTTRTWTYVLRAAGASSTGSANAATVLTTGTFRALGTVGTAGRAISTRTRALVAGI